MFEVPNSTKSYVKKNANLKEKLNLDQFILIQQQNSDKS